MHWESVLFPVSPVILVCKNSWQLTTVVTQQACVYWNRPRQFLKTRNMGLNGHMIRRNSASTRRYCQTRRYRKKKPTTINKPYLLNMFTCTHCRRRINLVVGQRVLEGQAPTSQSAFRSIPSDNTLGFCWFDVITSIDIHPHFISLFISRPIGER